MAENIQHCGACWRLHQAALPTTYWTYSFAAAVYLINRLPSPVIGNQSPYKKLFTKPPNYLKLRVFGCLCFPWLRPYAEHKLDNRSLPCVFLGYSLTQRAYLCIHLYTGRLYISRHVQFVETKFPYTMPKETISQDVKSQSPTYVPATSIPLSPSPLVQPVSSQPSCPDSHHQPVLSSPAPSVSAIPQAGQNSRNNLTDNVLSSAQVHGESYNSIASSPTQPETTPIAPKNIPSPAPELVPTSHTPAPPPVKNIH